MVMHRSTIAARVAALLLSLATAGAAALADGPSAVEVAKTRMTRGDASGAAEVLEAALPTTRGEARAALLRVLEEAYEAAARKAEADGHPAEADEYRENLAILRRAAPRPAPPAEPPVEKPRTRPEPPTKPAIPLPSSPKVAPPVTPAKGEPMVAEEIEPPAQAFVAPLPPPGEEPAAVAPLALPSRDLLEPTPPPKPEPKAPADLVEPSKIPMPRPRPTTPAPTAAITVEDADAEFLAKRYEKAAAGYALLDKEDRLPRDRRDHWAYCRAVGVVRRINTRPANADDWRAIDAEIEAIRALSPTNWFAEYLHKRAAERNGGASAPRALRPNQVIVRGSSPDEPSPTPGPLPNLHPAAPEAPNPGAATPPGSTVNWSRQPVFSTNFQVLHVDADRAMAEQVALAAEAARDTQLKRWGDPARGLPWSPRCEVVLFPTSADFSRETGQPADSPGFSTMGMNEGKVVLRRVLLRMDHPATLKAVLPHEVTHVVLADLFPQKQIPRWADEGMAVLAEPSVEQRQRASELNDPLATGKLFKLNDLMTMDYPESRHWPLYYAQSVSLTRFLVESESPAAFVKFVRAAQEVGFEPALKQVYRIRGFEELQARWLTFAKTRANAELTASALESAGDAEVTKTTR